MKASVIVAKIRKAGGDIRVIDGEIYARRCPPALKKWVDLERYLVTAWLKEENAGRAFALTEEHRAARTQPFRPGISPFTRKPYPARFSQYKPNDPYPYDPTKDENGRPRKMKEEDEFERILSRRKK